MKSNFVLLILTCLLYSPTTFAQSKLGYIDFQYIVSQVQAAQDVQLELQRLSNEWAQHMDAVKDSITLLEKDLETLSLTLTQSTRDILEKSIRDKKQDLATYQEQKFSPISGELYKKQQELLQPLIDKVKKAVDNVRLKEKYDVIFDISAGNPVSIDKKYDLTALVIEELVSVGLTVKSQSPGDGTERKSP